MQKLMTFIFLFILNYGFTQNWVDVTDEYIFNPDFEDTNFCPTNLAQMDACVGWWQPTMATSDYYNRCNTNSNGFGDVPSCPSIYGYQEPFSGDGFCGFLVYSLVGAKMWSEYIQTEFKKILEINKYYFFSMRVNRGDGGNLAVKNLGVNFSNSNLQDFSTAKPYNFNPSILNVNGPLIDTVNWININGVIKSSGNEKFLTIGWFGDTITDDMTFAIPAIIDTNSGEEYFSLETFYLVDSLKLYESDLFEVEINLPNIFTVNNDGINDFFQYSNQYIKSFEYTFLNRWGNVIYQNKTSNIFWDGITQQGVKVTDGVYYIIGEYEDIFNEKHQFSQFIHVIN